MAIDSSYFINDIAIANTGQEAIDANLDSAIAKYTKEALLLILGYELYQLYINNLTDQIYKDITDGKEFSFEFRGKTITRKWIGLENTEKDSLLAYYTYFQYEKDRNTFNSIVGYVTANVENAEQDNPRLKYVNSWNNYVNQRGDHQKINKRSIKLYLKGTRYRPDKSYFDQFELTTYEFLNDDPSLFNFLLANVSDYPKWEFTPVDNINLFDL